MASKDRQPMEIVERGDIFFLYRPRVGETDPESLSDVQRFFVVLRPEHATKVRLLVVGRKRLPDAHEHERHWGFVGAVAGSAAALEKDLREETYDTKTRGRQRLPAARPAGEGRYLVALLNGQLHLSYALELPERPSEVQRAFNIAPQASFALSVKNPEKPSPPGLGLGQAQEPDYPDRLQREFRGRRFAREDIKLLDVQGAEFILVGARTDPERAYNVEFDVEKEDERHSEMLRELKMAKSRHPIEPLFSGEWA
ncbi:MAG: hypothetical protein EOR84_20055 [Mesorhizobium sp.]|uniref:hypothetical protein n=1 Tax=Mesorhizobium sp. TaxID=1871066 RepID=UPI000FE82888|nr:hypothetical protein [Mesorhizobium sp.]RWM91874.1 MAG: hypothetical protein EOR84_20055 [Mesorhizobium sp.]